MNAIALVGAAWLVGYVLACAVWPYAACGRCKGTGKRRSPTHRYWGPCRWCSGAGRRMRIGRYLAEWWSSDGRAR